MAVIVIKLRWFWWFVVGWRIVIKWVELWVALIRERWLNSSCRSWDEKSWSFFCDSKERKLSTTLIPIRFDRYLLRALSLLNTFWENFPRRRKKLGRNDEKGDQNSSSFFKQLWLRIRDGISGSSSNFVISNWCL